MNNQEMLIKWIEWIEWIEDVYENYEKEILRQRKLQKKGIERLRKSGKRVKVISIILLTKVEFVKKILNDPGFAKRYGIILCVREFSLEERVEVYDKINPTYVFDAYLYPETGMKTALDLVNVPSKLISLEYNNKKVEIYG